MPKFDGEKIGVAFDMHGCPNRCRHCYLGTAGGEELSEDDVRWGVSRFREFMPDDVLTIRELAVSTWFREPDFGDDYRRLYDLEAELGDGEPDRYELLSIWRLARDETYAAWAKSVGPDVCQISFFGMRDTNDWFYRRKGAFDDALTATERLLDAGMKPRWQIFLTTKLLPELDELLALVDRLRLHQRVEDLGGEFQLFMHTPGPDHEGRKIENLRPTAADVANLPDSILWASRKHFQREVLWQTEESLVAGILGGGDVDSDDGSPGVPWFLVCSNRDVYSNHGTLELWFRLGNLKRDSVVTVVRRYANDETLGLRAQRGVSPAALTESYGDPRGQKIYSCREDLLGLYRAKYCEARH